MYTKEERLEIGRQIYVGSMTRNEAAEKYNVSLYTARAYMREYRDANNLPPKSRIYSSGASASAAAEAEAPYEGGDQTIAVCEQSPYGLDKYQEMSKEQLIHELVMSRIREERLKKGYEMKGDGTVIRYGKKSTK